MSRRNKSHAARASGSGSGSGSPNSSQDGELTDPALLTVRYGMKNTLELVAELLPACVTADDKKSVIKRLKTLMTTFVKSELSYLESANIINQVVEEAIPEDDNFEDLEALLSCEKTLPIAEEKRRVFEASLKPNIIKKHTMYVKLMRELRKYDKDGDHDNDDEDDSPTAMDESVVADDDDSGSELEHIPTIDPITKQKLTDPVRNTRCNHIYGRAAMVQLIKKNSKTRCPTMGCSNKSFVKVRDLATDSTLTALVRKKQDKEQERDQEESD